jgi:hypothetical protein
MARRQRSKDQDPVRRARQALIDVLNRAEASKDDERIASAAKAVLATHGSAQEPEDKEPAELSNQANWLPEEREVLRQIIVATKTLQNRVRVRLGLEEVPIRKSLLEPEQPPGPPRVYTLTEPAPAKPTAEEQIAALIKPEVVEPETDPFEGYDANEEQEYLPPRFITRKS